MSDFTVSPIAMLVGGLMLAATSWMYSTDFWSYPTPSAPEKVQLADTWTRYER